MWLMLQRETADDHVVATGETHSLREFVEAAFESSNLPWNRLVVCTEKIRKALWSKQAGSFEQLVRENGGGGAGCDRFRPVES